MTSKLLAAALALLASLLGNVLQTRAYLSQRDAATTARGQRGRDGARDLAAPPTMPGNACASAQQRVDNWLQGRAKP